MTRKEIEELADSLRGTCQFDPDVMDDMSIEELGMLDDLVLRCTQCNWWVEPSETNTELDEVVCNDCEEDE